MIVVHASGRQHAAPLAAAAVAQVKARTAERPFAWCGDGWQAYRPVRTGRRGRPARLVPEGLALIRRIKHRTPTGRLIWIETEATIGALVEPPDTVRVERLNGVLRDRLNALTRKTYAFTKTVATWDALLGLAIFEHNWLQPHPALRLPIAGTARRHNRRFERRTPAMALGLADHPWP